MNCLVSITDDVKKILVNHGLVFRDMNTVAEYLMSFSSVNLTKI